MVPAPMEPCAQSLGKKCHPLSGYSGAPHCKYWCWNRQGSHLATTSAPSPSTHTQPVSMVPPSWPCLMCPNEKLTAQATHQQRMIRLKHSTWHISPFGKLWFDMLHLTSNVYISHWSRRMKFLTWNTVIHLQFWPYESWDSLFPILMSPNCKLMSPQHYF